MSVLAMKRLNICAMKKDKKALLGTLQALGVMEIDSTVFKESNLKNFNTLDDKLMYERKAVAIENAIDVLKDYSEDKAGMFAFLEGKELVDNDSLRKVIENEEKIQDYAKSTMEAIRQIIENKVETDRNNVASELLEPWIELDIPMEFNHTKRTSFLLGTIKKVESENEIYDAIGGHLVDLSNVEVQIVHREKHQTSIVAVCLKEYEESVEAGLHTLGFARISNTFRGIPIKERERLEAENEKLKLMSETLLEKLKLLAHHIKELKILSDYYRVTAERYSAMNNFVHSKNTVFVSGYVPEKIAEKVVEKLEEKYELFVEVAQPSEDENIPVALENKGIGKSVEGIVSSFGLPTKKEIDPSNIMGFFYVFLFGLMLSDAAYGAIIFGACFFLLKRYKRMEDTMKTSIHLFMYCGISTFIWGILFGGYFGDVVTVFSQTFLGKTITIEPLWFAPIEDPMKLLMFSMLFGIIHLFVGLALKGYICIRDKEYMNLLVDVIFWYAIIIGLILMFLPSELFASLAQISLTFPSWVMTLAKAMAIIGALGILILSGRRKKNIGMRLALGAYDLYNITSWLSDLLSYSRLLALSLATGVIASVFNQMGSMMGDGIVGLIFFIVVFIIGHLFNMAINLLGAYVHTNRLQYVEFFGKFYEGGGKPFNPFKSNTKYVDIVEE